MLRRTFSRALLRAAPRRDNWHNLAAYTLTEKDAASWRDLRARDSSVEHVVDRFKKDAAGPVDWKAWEDSIRHKDIVQSLKGYHEQQSRVLDAVAGEDHKAFVAAQTKGWDLFDDAVRSCERSVEKSEEIVANGARALWISFKNPDVWDIDTNEWVDSDQYWQAFIEKHHFRNNAVSPFLDPESEACEKSLSEKWHANNAKFNDKSDVPINFKYMATYPSWEYYDVYRRAFLEHMTYYLVRTGGDVRFFPELPPWQWLTHIEQLRYNFVSVAQRRRAAMQLAGQERVRALDMQPADYDHGHGEHFHEHLIANEKESFELMAAKLMGSFSLFADSYVPVQTSTALHRALDSDGGKGKVFSLGDDVNALFYKPADASLPRPKDGLHALLDHLTMTGRRLNPGYSALLDAQTDLLELRGEHWLTAPGESVADAFMRRLKKDDPSYAVYAAYVEELKARWAGAKEVSRADAIKQIKSIEEKYKVECALYAQVLQANHHEVGHEAKSQLEKLAALHESGALQSLLTNGGLVATTDGAIGLGDAAATGKLAVVGQADAVHSSVAEFGAQREKLVEAIEKEKVAGLDDKKKK